MNEESAGTAANNSQGEREREGRKEREDITERRWVFMSEAEGER